LTDRVTIRKPDDWHLHVRDGEMLKAVMGFTARHFGRAIIMPNLVPPVTTIADALAYRERVMAAVPEGASFEPLMTCYLTDETDPDEVERGFADGVFTAVKLYPVGATTNSAAGVTDFEKIRPVLARMEKIGMRLLIHGEEAADPSVDVFDREAVFIEKRLEPMTRDYPGLRIVLEHLSSRIGVDYVRSKAPQVGGTITPYHTLLNRNHMLGSGIRPYYYCMPIVKREEDRQAVHDAAVSGEACFFLGTDSAPHPMAAKLAVVGCAGLFNAPVAIETYAKVFDEAGALDKLEAFASLNGPAHYGLAPNAATITLERSPWTGPEEVKVEGPADRALIYRGGETIEWRVVETD
jgi:dihydroorotase